MNLDFLKPKKKKEKPETIQEPIQQPKKKEPDIDLNWKLKDYDFNKQLNKDHYGQPKFDFLQVTTDRRNLQFEEFLKSLAYPENTIKYSNKQVKHKTKVVYEFRTVWNVSRFELMGIAKILKLQFQTIADFYEGNNKRRIWCEFNKDNKPVAREMLAYIDGQIVKN